MGLFSETLCLGSAPCRSGSTEQYPRSFPWFCWAHRDNLRRSLWHNGFLSVLYRFYCIFSFLYFRTGKSQAGAAPAQWPQRVCSVNPCRANATRWDHPSFVGYMWPWHPLVLPSLHPQNSSPRFLPLLRCLYFASRGF